MTWNGFPAPPKVRQLSTLCENAELPSGSWSSAWMAWKRGLTTLLKDPVGTALTYKIAHSLYKIGLSTSRLSPCKCYYIQFGRSLLTFP